MSKADPTIYVISAYTPEWSGRSRSDVNIGENNTVSDTKTGDSMTSHAGSSAAINPRDVKTGIHQERSTYTQGD